MVKTVKVYVDLLDEGSPTLIGTHAELLEDGFARLLGQEDYDPELEDWMFLPGQIVRLREATLDDGTQILHVVHPVAEAVRIIVESSEKHAPILRETYALPAGSGLYRVLPTPNYKPEQLWKFPPDSMVRLKEKRWEGVGGSYLLAIEPTDSGSI